MDASASSNVSHFIMISLACQDVSHNQMDPSIYPSIHLFMHRNTLRERRVFKGPDKYVKSDDGWLSQCRLLQRALFTKMFILSFASVLLDRVNGGGGVFSAMPLKLRSCPLLLIFCLSEWVCESLSSVRPFATPWTVAVPGSSVHGDSPGKNTGGGVPFPSPGHLPDPGIEPASLELAGRKGGIKRKFCARKGALMMVTWWCKLSWILMTIVWAFR